MGIQSQAALLFKSKEISLDDIVYLLEQHHAERRRSALTTRVRPKVTLDASLLAYKQLGTSLHPSDSVFIISTALANRNVDVFIICDPPTRHHSKRAHHQRVGKKETSKLQLMLCRMELSRSGGDLEKVQKLTNTIQKLEKAESRASLPSNFISKLEEAVSKYDTRGRGEISMDIAPFQADPSIADVAIRGGCEAILSGDSDFSMYVGPGGPDNMGDVMIRDIKISQKRSTITSGIIVTGQSRVARRIEELLSNREQSSVFPIEPKFPLFDGVNDPKMRALIAIALGCDALPGGVPGVGAASLNNLLKMCQDHPMIHVRFAEQLCEQRKAIIKDPQALLCIAHSLLYEKTNSDVGYMFDVPIMIEQYNEAFAAPVTQIIDGPIVRECKGCNGVAHLFLDAEGVSSCAECKSSLCRFCTWEDDATDNDTCRSIFCLDCKRRNLGIVEENTLLTEQEMRAFLKGHAVNVPVAATYAEVLRLYQQYDEDEHTIFSEDISTVRYPLLPTSALDSTHEQYNRIERIKTVQMDKIGEFVSSMDIDAASVLGFVQLMASLTNIQPRQKGETLTYKSVVPHNLLHMSMNARVHSGERLISRGLRHATDPATPSIYNGRITLGRYEGEICLVIENKVRASMKNHEYETKSAFTQSHFVATECNCRAGCSNLPSHSIALQDIGQGRIICSHGMTIPVALSLAMYKGLAAHILAELRLRLKREGIEDLFDRDRLISFRHDIIRLLKAAGKSDSAIDPTRSIEQCLDMFAVGTDLPKTPPRSPNPHDLGLLREKCRYDTPAMKAEKAILHNDESISNMSNFEELVFGQQSSEAHANFFSAQQSVDALSLVFGMTEFCTLIDTKSDDSPPPSVPIGFKLLRDRASDELERQEYNDRSRATSKVADRWKIALLEWTKERHHPNWHPQMKGIDSDNNTGGGDERTLTKKRKAGELIDTKAYTHHRCCDVKGCDGNSLNEELKRVADYPPLLPSDASRDRQITYYKKCFIRDERTERMGWKRECHVLGLRACKKHWQEISGKSVSVPFRQADGSIKRQTFPIEPFLAPVYVGKNSFKSPPQTMSRGNARDRATLRHLAEICSNSYALSQQQLLEMNDVEVGKQDLSQINDSILAVAGLDVHKGCLDEGGKSGGSPSSPTNREAVGNDLYCSPVRKLDKLTPKEVSRLTGFHDLKMLLSYVAVICDGDFDSMTWTVSSMTWLEEWILSLEFLWGHCMQRLADYESTYNCRIKTLRNVIRTKLLQIIAARDRWPMYASYSEDAKFRDPKWNSHFDTTNGHRVVMHDSTNIPMATPSDAAQQRALYNSYYGMCCAKAGVAVQLCSWIHGVPLTTGHSDDTRFIEDTKILAKQKQFSESDASSDKPFLNIFDKGYQCTLMASEYGQTCLQPAFAEFEKQFAANTTLYSGAVAVVRSGNERAVKRCKMSWLLKRGAREQMWDVDFLCDAWDAWTFQVNFMYEKFL